MSIIPEPSLRGVKLATVISHLEAIVAEAGPDFIYPRNRKASSNGCRYVYEGQPDCLMARLLSRLGVSTVYLASCEFKAIATIATNLGISQALADRLTKGQQAQDAGLPWGTALRCVKTNKYYDELKAA